MKTLTSLLIVLIVLLTGGTTLAQERLLFANDSSSGTYKKMFAEIVDVCQTDNFILATNETVKGGATANLEALVNNQVSAAFLHSDVIYAAALGDAKYQQLKTLVALYPEDIHVVSLRTSTATRTMEEKGRFFGTNKKTVPVEFNALTDLAGFKIGAAGGGAITSRILTGQGGGNFEVVEFGSGKELMPALDNGTVQAVLFVGGAPLDNIATLKGDTYKLIPIGEAIASKLSGVYRPSTINYANLRSGAIKTLSTPAIVLTRKYTTPKMIAPQARFRGCFYEMLAELQETPGRHPKWQLVDPKDQGIWAWYDLPTVTSGAKK